MAMLTSAIVSEGYAAVKQGFEREAEERARAFCDLTGAQDRTQQSVEELQSQLDELVMEVSGTRRHAGGARISTRCPFPSLRHSSLANPGPRKLGQDH